MIGANTSGALGSNPNMTPVNPDWIEATITFNGQTWTHVGVRYKGNSTLMRAWQSGSAKIPLKLDFDQFEDDYPEIKNQRFYGFKQLSLGNNLNDPTYLRDALSYDIMAAAGLITPEAAFYEVILDYGEGPVSLGTHTAVEVVDDTVRWTGLSRQGDGVGVGAAVCARATGVSSPRRNETSRTTDKRRMTMLGRVAFTAVLL